MKRGRSRIDEFFAILFSVLIASALTLGATLYVRVYYCYQPEVAPLWEYSQARVRRCSSSLDVLALNLGRARAARATCSACGPPATTCSGCWWRARASWASTVAETILAHRELGYRVVGFLDDDPARAAGAGLPVLGTPRPDHGRWRPRTAWTSSTSRCPSRSTPSCCS